MPAPPPPRRAAAVPVPPPLPPEPAAAGQTPCRTCVAAAALGDVLCADCRGQIRRCQQNLPGYDLVRELGRGGMGVVYLALRNSDQTAVAVKMLHPTVGGSRTDMARFFREASILQELDHPNIISFQDMGEVDGQFFFVMDFIRGSDARGLIAQEGPLPVGRAVGLICQLLQALDYAHAKGFVHRDIKPSNLLVTCEGGRDHARLADFGLARIYQASRLSGLTMTGEVGGTPAYMPPEQITNYRNAPPTVDQYAAAATLYTLLTGKHVYDLPSNVALRLVMVLEQDPVPIRQRRKKLPSELAAVIHRALSREPARRFASARAMRKALLPFLG
jgi:eukaryotic-like serine/threonine-protein kinase